MKRTTRAQSTRRTQATQGTQGTQGTKGTNGTHGARRALALAACLLALMPMAAMPGAAPATATATATSPVGMSESFEYNAEGEIISRTDKGGHVTRHVRDANGNITEAIDALGNSSLFEKVTLAFLR